MADDDLTSVLIRYTREVVVPEIDRAINTLSERIDAKHDEVLTHFDHVYKRLDSLASEITAIRQVAQIEQRISEIEAQLSS